MDAVPFVRYDAQLCVGKCLKKRDRVLESDHVVVPETTSVGVMIRPSASVSYAGRLTHICLMRSITSCQMTGFGRESFVRLAEMLRPGLASGVLYPFPERGPETIDMEICA